jgi:AcrR family transcriptional regulator
MRQPASEPVKRGRGRPRIPPKQQRQRLLDAAERSFEHSRYERASVQEIVAEAGMSTRSFYEFFDSKEDLVAELARERAETFLRRMQEVLQDADDFMLAIDRLLYTFLRDLPVVLLDLEKLGGAAGQRVREIRNHYRNEIMSLLAEAISNMEARGVIERQPSPMTLILVLAGIEGITMGYQSEGRREDLLALHPALLEAIRELIPPLVP